jgi:hypothetical protein
MQEKAVDQWVRLSGGPAYSKSYIDHLHRRVRDKLKGLPKDLMLHKERRE